MLSITVVSNAFGKGTSNDSRLRITASPYQFSRRIPIVCKYVPEITGLSEASINLPADREVLPLNTSRVPATVTAADFGAEEDCNEYNKGMENRGSIF
jgi:hypothetical protein